MGWGKVGEISGSRRSVSLAKRVPGEEPLPTSRFGTDMACAWPGLFFVAWLHFRLLSSNGGEFNPSRRLILVGSPRKKAPVHRFLNVILLHICPLIM